MLFLPFPRNRGTVPHAERGARGAVPPAAGIFRIMPHITARDLDAAMKGGAFAPVYYFHGDEDFRKDAALRRLTDAAVDHATRDFNLEVRRGAELDARSLESLLAT